MAGKIGSEKLCPIMSADECTVMHCIDVCEWNDGEGCAVWRIVKALERMNYWLEIQAKAVIQND